MSIHLDMGLLELDLDCVLILYSIGKFLFTIRNMHLLVFTTRSILVVVMVHMLLLWLHPIVMCHQIGRYQVPEASPLLLVHHFSFLCLPILPSVIGSSRSLCLPLLLEVPHKAGRFHQFPLVLVLTEPLVAVRMVAVLGGSSSCILGSGAHISVPVAAGIYLRGGESPVKFVGHGRLQEQSVLERVAVHYSDVVSQPGTHWGDSPLVGLRDALDLKGA